MNFYTTVRTIFVRNDFSVLESNLIGSHNMDRRDKIFF